METGSLLELENWNWFLTGTVPTSFPLNVKGFLDSSEKIIVTWEPVPAEHHHGIILGYHVMYGAQNSKLQQMTVNAYNLSAALPNLEKYMLYVIAVTAFTSVGQGPPSPAIVVRSQESVPSLAPPIVMAHGTTYSSIMVTWKAIPEDHARGIIKGYIVRILENVQDFNGCKQ
ncbi:hypothetical protein OS493_033016 [Desmophyllum pertusum]|uniref:Fibronectin type-III domain-containing protein n=1 Tax=Desmophyllum pertusum TaxID=174260 RepID=A0A9W9ZJK7_9CNID|nr:hypothetical protein OS493_033016 [Desmophyllum pertusum]